MEIGEIFMETARDPSDEGQSTLRRYVRCRWFEDDFDMHHLHRIMADAQANTSKYRLYRSLHSTQDCEQEGSEEEVTQHVNKGTGDDST